MRRSHVVIGVMCRRERSDLAYSSTAEIPNHRLRTSAARNKASTIRGECEGGNTPRAVTAIMIGSPNPLLNIDSTFEVPENDGTVPRPASNPFAIWRHNKDVDLGNMLSRKD